jgi:hypothetical protein
VRATLVDGAAFPHADDDFIRSMEAIEKTRDAIFTRAAGMSSAG